MKKLILFTVLTLFIATTASADQMVVQLKSGTKIIIDYSGQLNGVDLAGGSDSIVGMRINPAQQRVQPTQQKSATSPSCQSATPETMQTQPAAAKVTKEDDESTVKIRWADPISDENLRRVKQN